MNAGSGEKKGKGASILKLAAGLIGIVLLFAWTGGAFHSKVAAGKAPVKIGIQTPANAATYSVKMEQRSPRIDVFGTVLSGEKVNLSARIPANVQKVHVSAGAAVTKGQMLIELDDREIREQLTSAEAQLKQASLEYDRARNLFEKKATTQQALTAAESMFNSAKAQMERVKVMMTYAKVRSPIDGLVTERRVEAGDLANPGQLLLSVYDPGNIRIEVPVPVRLVDRLAMDQEVSVELDRIDRVIKGRVHEIVSEIDPASRTRLVKIQIEDGREEILPGTFGRVWVDEEPRPTLLAPGSSVYRVGQMEMVQIVRGDRAIRRMVKTGPRMDDGRVEILSGLKEGDVILVEPVKEG